MINVSTCHVKRYYWSLGAVYQPTDGRTVGHVGTAYTFQFMSWDLDGDPIKCRINWGDGTPLQDTPAGTGGVLVTATHIWTAAGTYNVKVQAVQTVGGVEGASAWSPFYAFNVTATSGSKLEGFLLMGPSGNAASSASKRAVMTVGEPVVSKMGSASYGISLRALGLPLSALQGSAGIVQILSGTAHRYDLGSYFDDPFDQALIGLGYNLKK